MDEPISLREHIAALMFQMDLRNQQRYDAQTTAINAALNAAKEAVIKAETATERRFDSVNEFRKTLSDQAATFVSRAEYLAGHASLAEKIDALASRLDKTEGHSSGGRDLWGYLAGAAGVVIAIVSFITR